MKLTKVLFTRRCHRIVGGSRLNLQRRTQTVGVGLVSLALLVVAGCTPELPTVKADPVPEAPPPILQPVQTDRILADLTSELTATATNGPGEQPARMAGTALTMRTAEYLQLGADAKATPDQLGTAFSGTIMAATDTWPRSFIAVTEPVDAQAQHLYLLTQADAQSKYQFTSWVRLVAGVSLPPTAPPDKGSTSLSMERSETSEMAPIAALEAYAAIKEDPTAPTAFTFSETDPARQSWADLISGWGEALAPIKGIVKHSSTAEPGTGFAIATADGGAIVFGQINSTLELSFSRTQAGESFTLPPRLAVLGVDDPNVTDRATISFVQTVALELPPAGSDQTVTVLGVFQTPVKATATNAS